MCANIGGLNQARVQDDSVTLTEVYSPEIQKEGQDDQGEVKELGLAVLRSPGPPGLPSGSPVSILLRIY